jgi:aminopeptidase N
MMRFFSLALIIAISAAVMSCQKDGHSSYEKGVSLELNGARKKNIDQINYKIELDIPAEKTKPIHGKQSISFNLKTTDTPLVLDFNSESSRIISLRSDGRNVDYTFEKEHIVVDPDQLKKGKNELTIEFLAGELSLNRSDEYLYTLFVPDRASTCFPLFDQPNLKATYSLTLKTPVSWEAVSNGALKEKSLDGGKSVYRFETTKPISSYLFAFAAGKFFKTTRSLGGREMTMYYRETDTAKVNRNQNEVFSLHAKSLDWLEKYTSIPYPFGKFDFVLLPSFQYGGMEHPGSIFYNESGLFLDENPSVNRRMARASVIAHESAHMWFGDLVTMEWFNDVWLKEVFANFMAAKIVHPSFPEINHNLRFLLAHYPAAYEVDRSAGTNPVLQELGNLKNAGTLYGAIIYQKAPIVMRQLERKIGEQLMQRSLREYLKTYAFGNARWDDLINIIDKNSPLNIAEWSKVWVKTPGMPVYDLKQNGATQITQETDSVSGRIWQQPVEIKWISQRGSGTQVVQMMDSSGKSVSSGNAEYVFPNADGAGYGYFKMDGSSVRYFVENYNKYKDSVLQDPVFRGAMLVNQWEGMVRGSGGKPERFVSDLLGFLPKEQNPLLVDYLLGNLQTAWWLFLTDQNRSARQQEVEKLLWMLLEKTPDKGIKTSYFRAFRSMAFTNDGLIKMKALWDGGLVVKDLLLSEDDKIALAYELALKGTEGEQILAKQLNDTKNPDRKSRMQFVIPALSSVESKRDAFFETLKKPENREKEAWVLDALTYLHHPLRQKSALKYLRPSLDMLQEIQLTGDIFFPTRWTHNTFWGHSSKESAEIAQTFLKDHPGYPFFLRNKILQATDMLDRAVMLKK